MPPARIHEAIAKEVNKNKNYDELLLRIGTVAPDSWRNVETNKRKYITHFWDFRIKENKQANDYQEFYLKYYKNLNNPFYFGYLVHLIVDQYWKTNIDTLYRIEKDGKIIFKLKDGTYKEDKDYWSYHDSIKMQKQVAKIYNLDKLPINKEELPNLDCNIDEINIDGLFGEKGTLNYINEKLLPDAKNEESEISDINVIIKQIKETKTFVEQELERLKKVKEENEKKIKIAVDIDDTILCTKELVEYYWKEFIKNNSQIENKKYKWGDPELALFWQIYREDLAFGKIKPGVQQALNKLLKKGYKVDLLSARPLEKYAPLKKQMVEYFEQNDINYDYLNIGFYEKKYFLQEHQYDILIDNDIRHMIEAEEIGITPILYGPYNNEYKGYQTNNWEEIPQIIEKIIKKKVKK